MLETPTRRTALPAGVRKALLLTHIVAALGWIGVTATFVVLTLWLLGTTDAPTLRIGYGVHDLMITWLARPAALLTLGTGLVLTPVTRWSLTRHWWVPAKLVLLVATVVVTVSMSPTALEYAIAEAGSAGTPAYVDAQHTLVFLAFYHVGMIAAAAALSIYKPGARRPRRGSARR